jgi:ferrous-iron efflux pump FieF
LFIGAAALAVAGGAVVRFMSPRPVEQPLAGIAVMTVAILINLWHVRNLRASMLRTGSQVMASEYVHYASDFLSHLGVIAALVLFKTTGLPFWDPLMSVFIVIYLVRAVASIFNNSISELLDEQLPDVVINHLSKTIRTHHPKIIDFHDLRTRKVGETKFIEFHLELRDVRAFEEAHDITESLISSVRTVYPGSVVTVHTDPEGEM